MQDGSLEIDGVLQPYILNGYVPWRDPQNRCWQQLGLEGIVHEQSISASFNHTCRVACQGVATESWCGNMTSSSEVSSLASKMRPLIKNWLDMMWWLNFSRTYGPFFVGFLCLFGATHVHIVWAVAKTLVIWCTYIYIYKGLHYPLYRDYIQTIIRIPIDQTGFHGMSAKGFVAVAHVVMSYAWPLRWYFNSTLARYQKCFDSCASAISIFVSSCDGTMDMAQTYWTPQNGPYQLAPLFRTIAS